jgi:hypothetical protein
VETPITFVLIYLILQKHIDAGNAFDGSDVSEVVISFVQFKLIKLAISVRWVPNVSAISFIRLPVTVS